MTVQRLLDNGEGACGGGREGGGGVFRHARSLLRIDKNVAERQKRECSAFDAGCDKTRKCAPSAYTNTSHLRKMPLHLPQESMEFIHVALHTHTLPTEK